MDKKLNNWSYLWCYFTHRLYHIFYNSFLWLILALPSCVTKGSNFFWLRIISAFSSNLSFFRFIQLPLFCAERCWAYAMQLKAEANTEPRKKFHMISRLKKAVQYANELVKLCESPKCDARTKLECQVFYSDVKTKLTL